MGLRVVEVISVIHYFTYGHYMAVNALLQAIDILKLLLVVELSLVEYSTFLSKAVKVWSHDSSGHSYFLEYHLHLKF